MTSHQEPPDWLLEQYHLGELAPEQRARVERAMATDPSVKSRLEALAADDQQVLASHPPARVAASIKTQAAAAPTKAFAWKPMLAGLAALTVTGVLIGVVLVEPGADDTRLKGTGAPLTLFRLTPTGAEPLTSGREVKAGDVVQPRFHLEKRAFVTVLSFDALGQVTIHSDDVFEAGSHVSANSFELDRTPGFERFVLITSPTKLPLERTTAAAREAARSPAPRDVPLPLPKESAQSSFVLLKTVSP